MKNFKAKKSIYFICEHMVLVAIACIILNAAKNEIITYAAEHDLMKIKAAMAQTQELQEENQELKSLLQVTDGKVIIINDGSARSKAMFEARKEWGDAHLESFERLLMSESGFRPNAQNPKSTAFGMFQFLDSTWKSYNCEKTEEVSHQIECGIKYIKARYQNPNNAWAFWLEHRWY